MYFFAPATGDHTSVAGCGKLTVPPSSGFSGAGTSFHAIWKLRGADHLDGAPFLRTPRTRHQYSPFGMAIFSVARVFQVSKWSSLSFVTGALKPASAAISNS